MSPGILAVRTTIPFSGGGGVNWDVVWASLILATVENAAPTHVVMTFSAPASTVATDITATVNGAARVVSSASWTGSVWTIVLASAVIYGDVIVMTFVPSGGTANVTNNVLFAALLTSVGTGAGVTTVKMQVSSNITVTLGANAKFYSDAGGTADESATWAITSGALRTIYLKCTTGTATMTFSDATKVTKWGDSANDGWASPANSARITVTINKLPLTQLKLTGRATLNGALPSGLLYILMTESGIIWTYTGALPTGLTLCHMDGSGIAWTYSGALPTGLTYLYILLANWTYNGALPTGLTMIYLNGSGTNWTGLDIGNNGNVSTFLLTNYRIAKMSSADMITLLTQLTNRTGTLPATITINDYADYASPPAGVVTAVNTLKAAKSITTVNLGA